MMDIEFFVLVAMNLIKTKISSTQHITFRQPKHIKAHEVNIFKQFIPQVAAGATEHQMKWQQDHKKIHKCCSSEKPLYLPTSSVRGRGTSTERPLPSLKITF